MSTKEDQEFSFESIIERIMLVEGADKPADIARALRVSSSLFTNWKKRGTMPFKQLLSYASRKKLSYEWLMKGEGDRNPQYSNTINDGTRPNYDKNTSSPLSAQRSKEPPEYGMEPVEHVSFIDVEAAINGIIRADKHMGKFPVPKSSLDEEGLTKEDVYVTPPMEGNCMLPTIEAGSMVVLIHTQVKIKDNSLYVLPIGDDLMLRRIQVDPRGGYIVKCDNPSYDNIKMTSDELNNIKITGRAMSQYSKLK